MSIFHHICDYVLKIQSIKVNERCFANFGLQHKVHHFDRDMNTYKQKTKDRFTKLCTLTELKLDYRSAKLNSKPIHSDYFEKLSN